MQNLGQAIKEDTGKSPPMPERESCTTFIVEVPDGPKDSPEMVACVNDDQILKSAISGRGRSNCDRHAKGSKHLLHTNMETVECLKNVDGLGNQILKSPIIG